MIAIISLIIAILDVRAYASRLLRFCAYALAARGSPGADLIVRILGSCNTRQIRVRLSLFSDDVTSVRDRRLVIKPTDAKLVLVAPDGGSVGAPLTGSIAACHIRLASELGS